MSYSENISQLRMFMDNARFDLKDLKLQKRLERRYPFDALSEEILSKVYSLIEAVIILIEAGKSEEAFGLSRSVVECCLTLRWITADKRTLTARALRFVEYGLAVKSLWYWWIKKQFIGRPEEREADVYAKYWDLVNEPSGAYRHWSGERVFTKTVRDLSHPLDNASDGLESRKIRMAHDYFHPGCFVHCSQPGMDNFFSESQPFQIHNTNKIGDYADRALFICHLYLHEAIAYSLYGMNALLSTPLKALAAHRFDATDDEFHFMAGTD